MQAPQAVNKATSDEIKAYAAAAMNGLLAHGKNASIDSVVKDSFDMAIAMYNEQRRRFQLIDENS